MDIGPAFVRKMQGNILDAVLAPVAMAANKCVSTTNGGGDYGNGGGDGNIGLKAVVEVSALWW